MTGGEDYRAITFESLLVVSASSPVASTVLVRFVGRVQLVVLVRGEWHRLLYSSKGKKKE